MFSNLRINVFKLKTKKKLIEFTLFYVMLKLWSKQNFLQKKVFVSVKKKSCFWHFPIKWRGLPIADGNSIQLLLHLFMIHSSLPGQTPPSMHRYWYKDKAYEEAGTSSNLGSSQTSSNPYLKIAFRKVIKIYLIKNLKLINQSCRFSNKVVTNFFQKLVLSINNLNNCDFNKVELKPLSLLTWNQELLQSTYAST